MRTGWYSTGSPGIVEDAIRHGGALGCVSALSVHGAWTLPSDRIHLVVGRGAKAHPSAALHWVARSPRYVVEPIQGAVEQAIRCLDLEAAAVALDSAVNRRLIAWEEVRRICDGTARGRSLLRRLDPASESGLETLARVRLRRLNLSLRVQVNVAAVGRVDLLIGDRLILELDGRSWHDRPGDFENDRRRDRSLVASGYLVMRASYWQVMNEWPAIEEQILRIVRRRDHRWRGSMRRPS